MVTFFAGTKSRDSRKNNSFVPRLSELEIRSSDVLRKKGND
jgi:hypothetical protein